MMHNCALGAVGKVEPLKKALQKVVNISRNFSKSDKQKGEYTAFVKSNLLKPGKLPEAPVKNRWNTFADALTRYMEIHTDLLQYANSPQADAAQATVIQANIFTKEELDLVSYCEPMLTSIKEACLYLQQTSVPSGVYYISTLNLMYTQILNYKYAGRHPPVVVQFCRALAAEIELRFNKTSCLIPCVLSLFDPRTTKLEALPVWLN